MSARPLRKVVSCRTKVAMPIDDLWERLKGLTYTSGPCIAGNRGEWGEVQIWASSHAVAEATVEAVLRAAGWDEADIFGGERWQAVARRHGARQETMKPGIDRRGVPRLSMRDGPGGQLLRPSPVTP